MENLSSGLLILIFALVALSVVLQMVSLIKMTQIQNNQKRRAQNSHHHNNNGGKRHGNQHNKKPQQDRANQNNRPQQGQQQGQLQQSNQNRPQQQPKEPAKTFEKIVSNAQPLKETNAQLANRRQGGKAKVYSERTSSPVNSAVNKPERPNNAPIEQKEMPKFEVREEKPQAPQAQEPKAEAVKAAPATEQNSGDVSYGRR